MAAPSATSQHLEIRSRLDELKTQCRELCEDDSDDKTTKTASFQPLSDFFSSVQLWKERSLHQTLETLDRAGVAAGDCHIEAMESHEKAAKDLFELARVLLNRTWFNMNIHLDAFAEELDVLVDEIVDEIVAAKLDEQRLIHENAVETLENVIQGLKTANNELKSTNSGLEQRLELLESTSGGGDAVLCDKLRTRCQHLMVRQHELGAELENAAEERLKHRRELDKTKNQLADSHKALALTKAMHDKETRQLAAMVQLKHTQVVQILEASRVAAVKAAEPIRQNPLERFDPLSGCMIVHLAPISSPQKPPGSAPSKSPRRLSSSALEPPAQTPPKSRQVQRPKSAASARLRPRTSSTKAST
ncbi:hypothetical protein DVH05_002987 [Phytophthora capsici]|nr:hypothetical protein DVH05_002987 [Phytophthora capsici]